MKGFFVFVLFYVFYFSKSSSEYLEEASLEWMKPNGTTEIDATKLGAGNITYNGTDDAGLFDWGWIVHLNEDPGYGIEIILDELSVDASADEYLILSGGTTADENSTMIQILTSKFQNPIHFRIPRTKSFFVKFSSTGGSFNLIYSRYGAPLPTINPPTADPNPPLEADTSYEIYLKGRKPQDFVNDETFILNFKTALKEIAKNYCAQKNLTFQEKPPDQTVTLGPVTRCPFEWPNDNICASVNHSIHVSGNEIKNTRIVKNYELTAFHLKDMWDNYEGNQLSGLGISVYELPDTSTTILWWILIVAICLVVIIASLIVFWKFEHVFVKEKKRESVESNPDNGIKLRNKNPARLSEYQNIPTFMTEPEAVLEYSKGSRRDKKPSKPPAIPIHAINTNTFETPTSSQTMSPLSPVTPAGSFTAGLHFNYNNQAFEEEEIVN